jgi:hypothetical protein
MTDFPRNHEERIIKRRTLEPVAAVRRRVVVALEPGDVLAVREEGRRTWYRAPVGWVFTQIGRQNAEAMRREKAAERKARRMGI